MKYIHTSLSNTGQKRFDNEDACGIYEVEDGLLAVLCDGLGGNKAGEVASQLTVETIKKIFIGQRDIEYLERLKWAVTEANNLVHEKSSKESELNGMATTAEAIYLKDDNVYWAHVGDSRIYTLMNGKLKQITKDHSLVQKLVDEGFLTLKEAENHPNKNVIMRALGDSSTIDIDLSKQKLHSKDDLKFFICSDGVTCVVRDDELQDILKSNDLDYIAGSLSSTIEERGAPDNYTFIIIVKSK